jgi:cell wall-associated NlpC family hydrolase
MGACNERLSKMQTEKVWTLQQVRADWLRVQNEVAYVRTIVAAHQLMKTLQRLEQQKLLVASSLKYSPDQPRISAGQSGGGQWTDGGGGGHGGGAGTSGNGGSGGSGGGTGRVLSDSNPDNFWQPGTEVAVNDTGNPRTRFGGNADPAPDARTKIFETAKAATGQSGYEKRDTWQNDGRTKRQPKCNFFVYDVLTGAGIDVPMIGGRLGFLGLGGPPTAVQWADQNENIKGWRVLDYGEQVLPGDIVAFQRTGETHAHVGLYAGDGTTISAPTDGPVQWNHWGFRSPGEPPIDYPYTEVQGLPTFRRYVGQ